MVNDRFLINEGNHQEEFLNSSLNGLLDIFTPSIIWQNQLVMNSNETTFIYHFDTETLSKFPSPAVDQNDYPNSVNCFINAKDELCLEQAPASHKVWIFQHPFGY